MESSSSLRQPSQDSRAQSNRKGSNAGQVLTIISALPLFKHSISSSFSTHNFVIGKQPVELPRSGHQDVEVLC